MFKFYLLFLLLLIKSVHTIQDNIQILIQGNYSVGQGALTKKKLLEDIKLKINSLLDNKKEKYQVKTLLKNIQINKNFSEENTSDDDEINNEEFNIFLSVKGTILKLIASSDPQSEQFYPYLQEGIGKKARDKFILKLSKKIVKLIYKV